MSATKRYYFPEIYAELPILPDPEAEQEKADEIRHGLLEDGIIV